jgi:hypothetical protein
MKRFALTLVAFLLILVCFTSCITYQKCVEKFNIKTDSIKTVVYRDTIIPVYIHHTDTVRAYSSIHDTLIVHSGSAYAESYVVHDTLKVNVWQTDTTLKVKIDSCIKIINTKEKQVITVTQKAKLEKILWQIIVIVGIILLIILIPRMIKKK